MTRRALLAAMATASASGDLASWSWAVRQLAMLDPPDVRPAPVSARLAAVPTSDPSTN